MITIYKVATLTPLKYDMLLEFRNRKASRLTMICSCMDDDKLIRCVSVIGEIVRDRRRLCDVELVIL